MKILAETDRLILRELQKGDVHGIYELDNSPRVHQYLGKQPIHTLAEAEALIEFIQQQYRENGIGRWAVIEKVTGEFLGWSGLKLITDPIGGRSQYYDLGYRFIERHWGKGYATESAKASLAFGFRERKQKAIFAMSEPGNEASIHVIQKLGFSFLETFDWDGTPHHFYSLKREDYQSTFTT
ncbi:MAG: GNAT family N-acetyltransferase [Saprospiraceae bacterium]|nr:GNAT family N-acetyltransferase [Saprospiraceae bacterium]